MIATFVIKFLSCLQKELRSVATDVVLSTKCLHEETLTAIRNAGNVSIRNISLSIKLLYFMLHFIIFFIRFLIVYL